MQNKAVGLYSDTPSQRHIIYISSVINRPGATNKIRPGSSRNPTYLQPAMNFKVFTPAVKESLVELALGIVCCF